MDQTQSEACCFSKEGWCFETGGGRSGSASGAGVTRRDSVPKADIDAAYKNVFEDEKNMQVLKDKKNTDLLCAWQPFHFLFRRGKKLPAPPLLEDDPMAEFLLPAPPVLEDDPMAEFF